MKTAILLLATVLVAGCSPSSRTTQEPPAEHNEGMAEAHAAIAGVKSDVLEQRVHALEVEIAELQNSAKATNTEIFDGRLRAVEAKVYAKPDAPEGAAPGEAVSAPPPPARKAPAASPRPAPSFSTYRPPTAAEREAIDRLARSAPAR